MATYCTAEHVAEILQLGFSFSESTVPKASTVERHIERAEQHINSKTRHSWKEQTSEELLDIPDYSIHRLGVPIFLKHRKVRTISSLLVWNGSEYENYLSNKTEGRNADYWIDEDKGVLYLLGRHCLGIPKGVDITYTWGETAVPPDIEEAAALLAAIKVLQSDDRSAIVSSSGSEGVVSYDSRVREWTAQVKSILGSYTEIVF